MYPSLIILSYNSAYPSTLRSDNNTTSFIKQIANASQKAIVSMKLRLDTPISKSIDLQLERQSRTLNHHLQREVEVVELHSPSCGQPGKQALGDCT